VRELPLQQLAGPGINYPGIIYIVQIREGLE